ILVDVKFLAVPLNRHQRRCLRIFWRRYRVDHRVRPARVLDREEKGLIFSPDLDLVLLIDQTAMLFVDACGDQIDRVWALFLLTDNSTIGIYLSDRLGWNKRERLALFSHRATHVVIANNKGVVDDPDDRIDALLYSI